MEPGLEMSRKRNSCQSEGMQTPLPLIGTAASPSPNGEPRLDDPSALEIVAAYHERTKHHYHRFAASLGYMDWATQPDPFRRYNGASLVRLPLPENGRALPYWQLYVTDSVEPTPLSIDSISLFFRYALSLTAWKRFRDRRGLCRQSLKREPAPDGGICALAGPRQHPGPSRSLSLCTKRTWPEPVRISTPRVGQP